MIDIVIPTFNDRQRLYLCLQGLLRQTSKDFRVWVVDDGGEKGQADTLVEMLRSNFEGRCRYLYLNPPSEGFRAGQARNLGLEHCCGDRVLFLDQDMIPGPRVVEQHLAYAGSSHIVIGRAKRIPERRLPSLLTTDLSEAVLEHYATQDDKRLDLQGIYRQLRDNVARGKLRFPVESYRFCWTQHLSCPTKLVQRLGGFWEEFNSHGGEDQELAMRLQAAGCNTVVDFTIVGYHIDHPLRGDPNSNEHWKLINRSKAMGTLIRNGRAIVPSCTTFEDP